MRCKIADLIVEVPAAGDLVSRCRDYLYHGQEAPDIVIRRERFRPDYYPENLPEDQLVYMESARLFAYHLLKHGGFYLHASAVEVDGRAYLFSANSGVGKSTHTRLWQKNHGCKAQIFNDDKPALRCIDGVWYAYGMPWCGKDGINQNRRVPLAGICFLKRGQQNAIRPLTAPEVIPRMLPQTIYQLFTREDLTTMLSHVDKLLSRIPVFELECLPDEAAARLSYETMCRKAEEVGL